MLGIIKKGEPDSDFDWREEFSIPILYTREVKKEVMVTMPSNIPGSIRPETREKIMDALCEVAAVRLVPIG